MIHRHITTRSSSTVATHILGCRNRPLLAAAITTIASTASITAILSSHLSTTTNSLSTCSLSNTQHLGFKTALTMSSSSSSSSPQKKQRMMMSSSSSSPEVDFKSVYGLSPGPYNVGVTTRYLVDPQRIDPGNSSRQRELQTEIWYPATTPETTSKRNIYSDFIGASDDNTLSIANGPSAFGGYRDGLTIQELDDPERTTWKNIAYRNAVPFTTATTTTKVVSSSSTETTTTTTCATEEKEETTATDPSTEKNNSEQNPPPPPFPLVIFSHGSGAYRASYIYWCEFLASHGYVVVAPDHPGSARFTKMKDGTIIVPDGGPRSDRNSMEQERPKDIQTVLNGIEELTKIGSDDAVLEGLVDTSMTAVTGMSFGGYTTAAFLEEQQDSRIHAAIMQCPSIAMSGTKRLHYERQNKRTPVMVMLGTEDTVIGVDGNAAGRTYVETHNDGDSYLLEITRGGHVSFTSCDLYNPEYGNGIGVKEPSKSLTRPGEMYIPLDISKQHAIINTYGLAFLNTYLKKSKVDMEFLSGNKKQTYDGFDPDELIFQPHPKKK